VTLARRLRLVLVTDRALARPSLVRAVARALRGGVTAVLLREKDLRGAELLPLAVALRESTRAARAALLVAERVDVAIAAGADAVHLGGDAMPIAAARAVAARRLAAGIAVHSAREGAARARRERPDYLVLGPVFSTPSRRGAPTKAPPLGLAEVRRLRAAVRVPIVAIGGIDARNAADVIAAGADGVAAIRALAGARDPARAARALAREVERGLAARRRAAAAGRGRRR